jgi:hypothetical protein
MKINWKLDHSVHLTRENTSQFINIIITELSKFGSSKLVIYQTNLDLYMDLPKEM